MQRYQIFSYILPFSKIIIDKLFIPFKVLTCVIILRNLSKNTLKKVSTLKNVKNRLVKKLAFYATFHHFLATFIAETATS